MENFYYDIPTKIHFGSGQIRHLAEAIKNCGHAVLLVYGGESILHNGVYNDVITQLKEARIPYQELSGVEPNPRYTSIDCGAELCRAHNLDVILAVGGGSVIDCAKVIAASVNHEGSSWELMLDRTRVQSVLPIVAVVTAAGTGSEMDSGAVISNLETKQKISIGRTDMYPRYTIMDPSYTFSVSPRQTAAGIADMMSHTFELYFNRTTHLVMSNHMCEAILKTCIECGPIALSSPSDYNARAELLWASAWAINGFLRCGRLGAWSCHPMEHPLSAWYDITHGVGLAILTPRWMRYILKKDSNTVSAFAAYATNVWEADKALPEDERALLGIQYTEKFFYQTLGLPSRLSILGIDNAHFEAMAATAVKEGLVNAYVPLNQDDVVQIYQASL